MKLIKTAGVLAVACGLVALSPDQASAQAPTVTWQALSSTILRVEWTPLSQATSYEVFVSGATIGTQGPFSVSTTFFQVSPVPAGSYQVAVRGRAGSQVGPLSNPVTVTMGGAPPAGCSIDAPSLSVSTAGSVLNVSWPGVNGAMGYRVQAGTAPGTTQISTDLSASQTSFSVAVPAIGTFYVRVMTANACGATATSTEHSFTIGSPTPGPPPPGLGTGPRAADPPPGQLIQRATLAYANGVIAQMGAQFNGDLQNSCREHGGNNVFLLRVVQRLRQIDSRWGLNDKRGNPGDMSQDIISYNPTNRPDNGESQIYLFDIISGHCGGGRADVWFNDVTGPTWAGRGSPACGTEWCARWTIDAYLRAGLTP